MPDTSLTKMSDILAQMVAIETAYLAPLYPGFRAMRGEQRDLDATPATFRFPPTFDWVNKTEPGSGTDPTTITYIKLLIWHIDVFIYVGDVDADRPNALMDYAGDVTIPFLLAYEATNAHTLNGYVNSIVLGTGRIGEYPGSGGRWYGALVPFDITQRITVTTAVP